MPAQHQQPEDSQYAREQTHSERTMYFMDRTRKSSFTHPVKASNREPEPAQAATKSQNPQTPQNPQAVQIYNPPTPADLPVMASSQPDRQLPGRLFVRQNEAWMRQRKRNHYKLVLYHFSRKHLRQAWIDERRTARHFWLTLASILLFLLVLFLSVSSAASYAAYRFYMNTQQHYGQQVLTLYDLLPRDNLKMYDRNGILIGQLTDQGLHTSVTLDQVAPPLVNATIATEDKNFWTNPGIDMLRILRAALDDVRSGHVVEGGSTITQQLIKNLLVGNEVTVQRKLEELVLVPQVNTYYSKQDILQMYLNSIYYGEQAYGIDAAATVYFGLTDKLGQPASAQLDLAQAAMLAGLPSSPDLYDPLQHPQAAFERFQTVLLLMEQQGYITRVQQLEAIKEAQQPNFFKSAPGLANRAPHFFNFVLTQLEQTFHLTRAQLSRSDMQVYTTLDITLQDKIQQIMQQHIAALRYTHNVTNAAEVLLDYHTGAIISLLGSVDYNDASIDGQFDVATQAYRQPGSSFKPYVYAAAMMAGLKPTTILVDREGREIARTLGPEDWDKPEIIAELRRYIAAR